MGSLTVGGTLGGPDALKARISQVNPDFLGRLSEDLKRNLKDALATRHDKLLRLGYTLNVTSRAQLSLNATRQRQGRIGNHMGGLCLADDRARLAHGGQRRDVGRRRTARR